MLWNSQKLERCYNVILGLMTNSTERENNEALNAYVSFLL